MGASMLHNEIFDDEPLRINDWTNAISDASLIETDSTSMIYGSFAIQSRPSQAEWKQAHPFNNEDSILKDKYLFQLKEYYVLRVKCLYLSTAEISTRYKLAENNFASLSALLIKLKELQNTFFSDNKCLANNISEREKEWNLSVKPKTKGSPPIKAISPAIKPDKQDDLTELRKEIHRVLIVCDKLIDRQLQLLKDIETLLAVQAQKQDEHYQKSSREEKTTLSNNLTKATQELENSKNALLTHIQINSAYSSDTNHLKTLLSQIFPPVQSTQVSDEKPNLTTYRSL